jgi:hypothetical protein
MTVVHASSPRFHSNWHAGESKRVGYRRRTQKRRSVALGRGCFSARLQANDKKKILEQRIKDVRSLVSDD